jgi:hypothetical protein
MEVIRIRVKGGKRKRKKVGGKGKKRKWVKGKMRKRGKETKEKRKMAHPALNKSSIYLCSLLHGQQDFGGKLSNTSPVVLLHKIIYFQKLFDPIRLNVQIQIGHIKRTIQYRHKQVA